MIDTLRSLLFEEPWPLIVGCIALAAVAFLIARAFRKTTVGLFIVADLLGLAILAIILSTLITTDHEHVQHQLDQLLHLATDTENPQYLAAAAPDLKITTEKGNILYQRPQLDEWAQKTSSLYGILRHRIWSQSTSFPSPDAAITEAEIRTYIEASPTPARTFWQIRWTKTPDNRWQATEMRWVRSAEGTPGPGSI